MTPRSLFGGTVRIAAYASCAALLAAAAPAAADEADSCTIAYNSAQERVQAGQLVAADQLLQSCANPVCGSPLWQECALKDTELRSITPSIVPLVTDETGQPQVDVQVKIDGALLSSRLDGRALRIDPGTHELSFSNASGVFATEKISVARGQRNRPVAVSLRTADKRAHK
jgi:hypothetical protein